MKFDSDRAYKQLVEHGIVATMRFNRRVRVGKLYTQLYVKGVVVRITRRGRTIGKGMIVDVLPNTRENREKLVYLSGFSTVEEWEEEARKLYDGRLPNTILVVKLIDKVT